MEDVVFWKPPLYALEIWYVSPPRKCHEKLGPDDKSRWEDTVMCFMVEGQLQVRNVYMYVCIS